MINALRKQFPFIQNNKELIYLDNAATTQKPQRVIDAMSHYYATSNAPVHRGIYRLAEHATELYEQARADVAHFIGARSEEIIFTKGTTEAINLIAASYVAHNCKPGDEIIVTPMEHHSNLVPWIMLERTHGIVLRYIPMREDGSLEYGEYTRLLNPKTKLVAVTHSSNVLGSHVVLQYIIKHAHNNGTRVLIDAAQAAAHTSLNVRDLRADFLVFSAHKMYGPTGIGALFVSHELQDELASYEVGGGTVHEVDFHQATFRYPPHQFEAGTPPIAEAVGFREAVVFMRELPLEEIKAHEAALTAHLISALENNKKFHLLGSPEKLKKSGHMVSFTYDGMHPHDIAAYLDSHNICVRAGDHCAQPLHKSLGLSGSVRVSFGLYNTVEEVDKLIALLLR